MTNFSDLAKNSWKRQFEFIDDINNIYSFEYTKEMLKSPKFYYKMYYGRAKNRTMMVDEPILFKSIYYHTRNLEAVFIRDGRSYPNYNFSRRMQFIVERNGDLNSLKCDCGMRYGWTSYCRKCPEYHKNQLGKPHSEHVKRKMRKAAIKRIQSNISRGGQIQPLYNSEACKIIDEYGKKHGYNFQHAENGGEYHIKELGYFVDGYDSEQNVVIEIDEKHHFDHTGKLKKKDVIRQHQIEEYLGCNFIRIRI